MLTSEQKILAALSHGSSLIGLGIIAPLIIMLVSKDDYVKTQAKEALIFQLVIYGGMLVSVPFTILIVGFFGLAFFGIAGIVLSILALVNVIDGKDYSYPVTGKWARGM